MAQSPEIRTIHVIITNEQAWRPVLAEWRGGNTYLIIDQPIPRFEEWEFVPGDVVATEVRIGSISGRSFVAATEKVSTRR